MKITFLLLFSLALCGCAANSRVKDPDAKLYNAPARIVPVCQQFSSGYQCMWIELGHPAEKRSGSSSGGVVTERTI